MSTPKSVAPGTVLSLGARFVTKVGSFGLSEERVQQAINDGSDPLWVAVTDVLCPQPDAMAQQVAREEAARPRIKILSERPKPCANRTVDEQVFGFKQMYEKLGWTFAEFGLVIPKRQKGIDRLLALVNPVLTNNLVFDVCDASFKKSWKYTNDLDSAIPADRDQRHPRNGPYFVWVKDEVDSDHDLRNLSTNTIAERGLKTETLLEYQIHHLIHFHETGEHLDTRTWTLCAGSRRSDGCVPCADWLDDRFRVNWCTPALRNPVFGARQAVSL